MYVCVSTILSGWSRYPLHTCRILAAFENVLLSTFSLFFKLLPMSTKLCARAPRQREEERERKREREEEEQQQQQQRRVWPCNILRLVNILRQCAVALRRIW